MKCKQGLLALALRATGEGYFVMAITMAHTVSTFTRLGSGAPLSSLTVL